MLDKIIRILNIILLLLIIVLSVKVLFFISGNLLKTSMPYVVVESSSMHHSKYGFNIVYPFSDGLDRGDIVILKGEREYKVGDIIVFVVPSWEHPIIHRIISKKDEIYSTKGDNNFGQHDFELNIKSNQIIGKAILKIPFVGLIKIVTIELIEKYLSNN